MDRTDNMMRPLGYKYIFGRLTFYVSDTSLKKKGIVARWIPLEGEEFDIIKIDPYFKNPRQAIIHEEIHALFNRVGLHQTELSEEVEETIAETVSNFFTEMYL